MGRTALRGFKTTKEIRLSFLMVTPKFINVTAYYSFERNFALHMYEKSFSTKFKFE